MRREEKHAQTSQLNFSNFCHLKWTRATWYKSSTLSYKLHLLQGVKEWSITGNRTFFFYRLAYVIVRIMHNLNLYIHIALTGIFNFQNRTIPAKLCNVLQDWESPNICECVFFKYVLKVIELRNRLLGYL